MGDKAAIMSLEVMSAECGKCGVWKIRGVENEKI